MKIGKILAGMTSGGKGFSNLGVPSAPPDDTEE
jgi:hypothetical protein